MLHQKIHDCEKHEKDDFIQSSLASLQETIERIIDISGKFARFLSQLILFDGKFYPN